MGDTLDQCLDCKESENPEITPQQEKEREEMMNEVVQLLFL